MRTVTAVRYVTPLREGGSVPAIVEGDDDGLYVVKFRGAGQGIRALVAEVVAGELGRAAGLRVPEQVLVEMGPELGRNEPDQELRDLLRASVGRNVGLDYLPGSVTFDPLAGPPPDGDEASEVVLFDALVQNVDRTPRNPNLLVWHRQLWLIDHGAALYVHHAWASAGDPARPFPAVKDHVLLPWATALAPAAAKLAARLPPEVVARVVGEVPDAWLEGEPAFPTAAAHRTAYQEHLVRRLAAAARLAEEADRAREQLV